MRQKISLYVVFFILIFLAGLFFRVGHMDLTRLEHEQVRDIQLSASVLEGNFPLHGALASVEGSIQNTFGPLSYYLGAIGLALAPNNYWYVVFPILILALLDLLGVYFIYQLGKTFFNNHVGYLAATFYLVCSWHIVNVVTVISHTSYLPFFVVLFFYCLFKTIIAKEDIYVIPTILALALQLHFHLTSALLGFSFLVVIALFRRDINKKYFLIGCFLALLALAPYMYYTLSIQNFTTLDLLQQRDPSTLVQSTLESFGIPLLFMTPHLTYYQLGVGVQLFTSPFVQYYFALITGIFLFLFLCSVLYLLYQIKQKRKHAKSYLLLLLLFFIPSILFAVKSTNIAPHYFIITFPLQFIILGIFLSYLLQRKKLLTTVLIVVLLLSHVVYLFSFYAYVENYGGTQGIYGVPYAVKMGVVDYVLQDTASSQKSLQLVYYNGSKPLSTSMNYLFGLHTTPPLEITFIDSITQFQSGYLIIDRSSFYKGFTGKPPLSSEEHDLINEAQPQIFTQLELVKR